MKQYSCCMKQSLVYYTSYFDTDNTLDQFAMLSVLVVCGETRRESEEREETL